VGDDAPPSRAQAAALAIVAVAAGAAILYFGRDFFVPIVFAFLLNAVFRPLVRRLERLRVPPPAGAAVVVLGVTAAVVGLGFALSVPVQTWWADAPQLLDAAERKLSRVREPMARVSDAAHRIERVAQGPASGPTTGSSASGGGAAAASPAETTGVIPAPVAPSLVSRVFGGTARFVGGVAGVLLLLFLLLASGDLFVQKLVRVMPLRRDKRVAIEVVDEAQGVVLRYLLVTLLINLGQGAVVGLTMSMLGLGHPLIWGLFTVVFEFIPYLGAAIMIVVLTIVAAATFDHVGRILLVPASYLLITTLQNNIVSPYAYGNRLKLNPVAVLIGVLLWWFLWGIPGAFLAVPIIAVVKIVSDRTEGLTAIGEFLGE